jgi:hypothetical protein
MRADLDRVELIRRGEALTPEEEQRIRIQARREAFEARIRREERAKVRGFPYYPLWLLPTAVAVFASVMVVLAVALVVILSLHR